MGHYYSSSDVHRKKSVSKTNQGQTLRKKGEQQQQKYSMKNLSEKP